MILVFHLIDDVGRAGMGLIVEIGRSPFDGYQIPEELGHLVLVGIVVEIGSGQMEVTFGTDDFFCNRQPMATDHTESWGYQVE